MDGEAAQGAGRQQLSLGESIAWYTVAAATYIGAGVVEKSLLNWFVGPLWLVVVVWAGPPVVDRLRHRSR
jgi:hypothetical protein